MGTSRSIVVPTPKFKVNKINFISHPTSKNVSSLNAKTTDTVCKKCRIPNSQSIQQLQPNLPSSFSTPSKNIFLIHQFLLLKSQKMVLEHAFERTSEIFTGESREMLQMSIKKMIDQSYAALFDEVSNQTEVVQQLLLSESHIGEETRLLSTILSVIIAISRIKSYICFSSTLLTNSAHDGLGVNESTRKLKRRDSTVRTKMGDFTESSLGSSRTDDGNDGADNEAETENESIEQIQEINQSSENFICRICEEVVPLDLIEAHSALCIKAHLNQYHFYKCCERLKKIQQTIQSKILNLSWPGEQNYTVSVIFPILYYYSLIGMAIDVQNIDIDAIDQLETIIQGLNSWEVPETEMMNINIYVNAKKLVIKKLQCCQNIAETTRKICSTTRRHRVSTTGGFQTNLSDFEFITRLSSGAFARVYLSKKNRTGDLYAIKVIKRANMAQKNQIRSVSAERDIMRRLHSPYVVNFYYSFVEKNNLYLVMEYIPGGDIFSLLQNVGSLSEDDTRKYTVQLIKALEFLRDNGIIHRDLKPDNVLINSQGFIKLADFGLSYFGVVGQNITTNSSQSTNSNLLHTPSNADSTSLNLPYDQSMASDTTGGIVGTPDYMAPEVIMSKKHTFTADYWSLGAMVFEMLSGVPPFHGIDEVDTFRRIMMGAICWDEMEEDSITNEARDFIKKLLVVNPSKRLGANSIKEIMQHPWFTGIDWDNIDDLEPVFVPDTSSIDSYKDYFQDRYQFRNEDERDIIEDIETAQKSASSLSSSGSTSASALLLKGPVNTSNAVNSATISAKSFSHLSSLSVPYSASSSAITTLAPSSTPTLISTSQSCSASNDVGLVSMGGFDEVEPNEELTSFPSVSLEQLKNSNVELAQKIRQRNRRTSDCRVTKDQAFSAILNNAKPWNSNVGGRVSVVGSPLAPSFRVPCATSNTNLLNDK